MRTAFLRNAPTAQADYIKIRDCLIQLHHEAAAGVLKKQKKVMTRKS